MGFVRNPKDVLSGLLFIVLAAVFWWQSQKLVLGSSARLGPGYFPILLSALLGFIGLLVLMNGLRVKGQVLSGFAWRELAVVTAAIVFFALALHPLGFAPALALTVFASACASIAFRPLTALVIAGAMTAFGWAVFIIGLGLPLSTLGPWLGGH